LFFNALRDQKSSFEGDGQSGGFPEINRHRCSFMLEQSRVVGWSKMQR